MFLRKGASSNVGGTAMLHGMTSGERLGGMTSGGRLGRLTRPRGMNGVGLGEVNPYVQDITEEASYLTNWYRDLFPTQQTQTYMPVQTGAQLPTSNMTTYLMLGGLALGAFLFLKK